MCSNFGGVSASLSKFFKTARESGWDRPLKPRKGGDDSAGGDRSGAIDVEAEGASGRAGGGGQSKAAPKRISTLQINSSYAEMVTRMTSKGESTSAAAAAIAAAATSINTPNRAPPSKTADPDGVYELFSKPKPKVTTQSDLGLVLSSGSGGATQAVSKPRTASALFNTAANSGAAAAATAVTVQTTPTDSNKRKLTNSDPAASADRKASKQAKLSGDEIRSLLDTVRLLFTPSEYASFKEAIRSLEAVKRTLKECAALESAVIQRLKQHQPLNGTGKITLPPPGSGDPDAIEIDSKKRDAETAIRTVLAQYVPSRSPRTHRTPPLVCTELTCG